MQMDRKINKIMKSLNQKDEKEIIMLSESEGFPLAGKNYQSATNLMGDMSQLSLEFDHKNSEDEKEDHSKSEKMANREIQIR